MSRQGDMYEKKLKELGKARERFLRGGIALYHEDGTPRYEPEEFERRADGLLERFEVVARKLLRNAERDAEKQRQVLAKFPEGSEAPAAKRARILLQLAERFGRGVQGVREEIQELRTRRESDKGES